MTGDRYFADGVHAYGITHVFFVPTIMLPAMAEMEDMDIRRVVTHGEKAAAYMADGYARASRRPGICNYALNQEKHLFDAAYKGQQRGRATEMWHFSHEVNFAKVAEAMGCVGIRVERPEDIRPALEKALASHCPAVVEVISDVDAMSKRAWRP